jgi:glutathione S-transferase
MIKLWGRPAVNTQKVMWALAELGVSYERFDIGGKFGGTDSPDYRSMNPNGLVPTLQDGEVTLWESHAIVRYLAHRYGSGTLEPSDPGQYGRANQWMDWTITTLTAPQDLIFGNLYFRTPSERDENEISQGREAFTSAMHILDAHLLTSEFAVGPTFSMGDIPLAVMGHRYLMIVPVRPALLGFDRWMRSIRARPAFVTNVESIQYVQKS